MSTDIGYDTAQEAACQVLNVVRSAWHTPERLRAQAFVLAALDTIPHTAALVSVRPGSELGLVNFMQ